MCHARAAATLELFRVSFVAIRQCFVYNDLYLLAAAPALTLLVINTNGAILLAGAVSITLAFANACLSSQIARR